MKSIKNSLKKVEDDFVYVEFSPLVMGEEFEEIDEGPVAEAKPDQFYQWLVDLYNESYIDGDSSSAYIVYDPTKKKAIFGSMNIACYTAEEFEGVLREWEED